MDFAFGALTCERPHTEVFVQAEANALDYPCVPLHEVNAGSGVT